MDVIRTIAAELSLPPARVTATLALFDEGATLPFVARYRKEVTGGLDERQLADVRDRAAYLRELDDRRQAILESIASQDRLDDALRARILAADTKQALEDLYLPYKPKRRTRATIARERGLEPLADLIWSGAADDAAADHRAAEFVAAERGVASADDAIQGALDILAERIAEDADTRALVRERTRSRGVIRAHVVPGKEQEAAKFRDYHDYSEQVTRIPSHRMLAVRRGEAEELLRWSIEPPADELVAAVVARASAGRRARTLLARAAEDAYRRLLAPSIESELRTELKTSADAAAIAIFGQNLEQLLLAAPAGERIVLGLDPGFRTGVKAGVVSRTGALLDTATLYLHREDAFAAGLRTLVARHGVELVAIGNGTASRETETLVRRTLADVPAAPQVVVVNEAGASVYSASDVARAELPDLDVSLRGAPSIARRLQDPLAELVKIDPKSIGVGQYQHDVDQPLLRKRLDEVVEICVNRVGVEANTASASLLSYVAGIGPTLARNIVATRDAQGGFRSRRDLLAVPRLGPKAFEQAAGFLRVRGGAHPLDATAVHPERYALVERMAADLAVPLADLVANDAIIDRIQLRRYLADDVGMPTLQDIVAELRKPGRDPRENFEPPAFRDDVQSIADLKPGMRLDGVVTNLVAFGAFVDLGVHQDGLVHISQLADRFVKDPAEIVRVGQKVTVTVLTVDIDRNRIGLSMRTDAALAAASQRQAPARDAATDLQRAQPRGATQDKSRPAPKSGSTAPNGMRFR
jgi:protein Tex